MDTATRTFPEKLPVRVRVLLGMLSLGAFTLGTAETLPIGVLTQVASSVDRSPAAVGVLVTAYAVSLAVGGIVLGLVTARASRRLVLVAALLGSVVANLVLAVSDSFPLLMAARVLGGAAHGMFVGAAISVAIAVVPPARTGRAIAAILTGFAAATALGVPAGVLVADRTSWHVAFAVVAVVAAALTAGLWLAVSGSSAAAGAAPAAQPGGARRHLLTATVARPLGIALALFAGQYAAFTYLDPFLQQVTGISAGAVGGYVLAFGAAAIVGSTIGGRLADWNARAAIALATALPPVLLGALLVVGGSAAGALAIVLGWGLVVVAAVPAVQYLVAAAAGPARAAAAVLPAAVINLGIASGSLLGGRAVDAVGIHGAVIAGALLCAAVVPFAWHGWIRPRAATTTAAAAPEGGPATVPGRPAAATASTR